MKKVTKEELKEMGLGALLDLVGGLVGGPIGVCFPVLGNVLLNAKSTVELKKTISELEDELQDEIKEQAEELYEELYNVINTKMDAQQVQSGVEIYSIDALEVVLGTELNEEEIGEVSESLAMFRGDGVVYKVEETGEEITYHNDLLDAPIDTYVVLSDRIIFNLLTSAHRDEVQELIESVEGILEQETRYKMIKKLLFY